MDAKKAGLVKKAQKIYGKIYPCINKPSFEECFTIGLDGEPVFWFNTEDKSTHMVTVNFKIVKSDKKVED